MKDKLFKAGFEATATDGGTLQKRIAGEVSMWKEIVAKTVSSRAEYGKKYALTKEPLNNSSNMAH